MKILILSIGKTKDLYLKEGLRIYLEKLGRYCTLEWNELPDVKNAASLPTEELKKREGQAFLEHLLPSDHVILLDEQGKTPTSGELSVQLQGLMNRSVPRAVFIIGGAFGFDKKLYETAKEKLALSRLTFTHQMVRLIVAEQLYRAFTILNNEKYHH